MENTFTVENINNLKSVCEKTIKLLDENVDGALMMVQLLCLADNIKDFINNPIVKNSGIINNK